MITQIRTNAARKIQRLARRTVLRTNSQSFLRIDVKLFYFTPIRHKLLTDFQVKIAYHYRKHLKRVAEKKRIEEEKRKKRLAAAAKKKGGKKGKKGKKKAATLTPKQGKDITTVKDEKNLTELEPGVD